MTTKTATITVDRKALLRALKLAARIAPKRSPKPILENVLIEANGGQLTVTATDLERYSRTTLDCSAGEWSALVSAKALRDTVQHTKGDTLPLSIVGERNLLIGGDAGRPSAVLVGDLPEMFPAFPVDGFGQLVSVAAADLRRMVSQVKYAAAREASRYMINGIHVVVADGRLSLVATDGRRLAVSESLDTNGGVNAAETVPLSAMEALRVSIAKGDDRASIEFGTTMVRFCFGPNVLVSQLLDSRFPDYAAVIPKTADVSITVDRAELVAVIKRLSVHAADDIPLVMFDASPDRLSVAIESASGGSGSATLTPTGKGIGAGSIGFNPGYVLEALKASDSADVTVSFIGPDSPATFALGFRYVLMPIQGG